MPRPVYWKPKYPTRRMRERAYAKQDLLREQHARASAPPSLLSRLRALLKR